MSTRVANIRENLPAAFSHLALRPDSDERVSFAINELVLLATGALPKSDFAFRNAGRKAVKTEIDDVARVALMLAERIENLHEPSIQALANQQGIMRSEIADPQQLRQFAAKARRVDVGHLPEKVARGTDLHVRRAHVISKVLARQFSYLTGESPTLRVRGGVAYGPFLKLVTEVFVVLGIRESPESAARAAMEKIDQKPAL